MITLVCKKCHKPIGDTCCCKEKQKWVEEIIKILEKVIEEEYGEGEEVVKRIVNNLKNRKLTL